MVSTRPRKLNFNREIGKRYVWMAFPGNPKMCFVITGCCIHNTSIKYKSYTGQFLAQTQHSNYCIFTLVNREKLFSGLNCKRMYTACGFFFVLFFSENKKIIWLLCPDIHTWPYTHIQTEAQIPLASQPASFPCCAWSGVLSSSAEHREMTVVPCSLVFYPCLFLFKPQNTTEKAASFWQTLLGVHLLTC